MRVDRLRFVGRSGLAALAAIVAGLALVMTAAAASAASSSLTVSGTVLATNGEPNPAGVVTARCVEGGTLYALHFTGLNPKAVYTVWGIVFTGGPNGIAVGSLGQPDGSQNVFRASAAGAAQFSLFVPGGGQTSFGCSACRDSTPGAGRHACSARGC